MSAGRGAILKTLRPWVAGLLLVVLLLPVLVWIGGPRLLLHPVRDQLLSVKGVERGFTGVDIERIDLVLRPGIEVSLHRVRARLGLSSLTRGHWNHLEAEQWEVRLDPTTTSLPVLESALNNLYRLRASSFTASAGVLYLSSEQPSWQIEGAGQRRDSAIVEVMAELRSPLARLDLFALLAGSALESSLHFEGALLTGSRGPDTAFPLLSFLPGPVVSTWSAPFSQLNLEGTVYLNPRHQADSLVILFNGTGLPLAPDDPSLGHEAISGGLAWRRGEPRRLVVDLVRAGNQWGDLRFGAGAYEIRWREDGPLWIYSGPLPFSLGEEKGEVRLDIEVVSEEATHLAIHATAKVEWAHPSARTPKHYDAQLTYRFDAAPEWSLDTLSGGEPGRSERLFPGIRASRLADFPWKALLLPEASP